MQINIEEKYIKNIINVYGYDYAEKLRKNFSKKEQGYWLLTLSLLKKNPDKKVWDSIVDQNWLKEYLPLFFSGRDVQKFTINEWFNYLNTK